MSHICRTGRVRIGNVRDAVRGTPFEREFSVQQAMWDELPVLPPAANREVVATRRQPASQYRALGMEEPDAT